MTSGEELLSCTCSLAYGHFFGVLSLRLHKVCFWGLASSPPSVPGCEFWALASQLTWCWLLADSPLGTVVGLPGTLLGWAPGTQRPASLPPWGHTGLGIPLWTRMELYSPWHLWCQLPKRWIYQSVYLSTPSFRVGLFLRIPVMPSRGVSVTAFLPSKWASLIAQLVKNPSAMQETLVRLLNQEDPLEKG